MVPLKVVTAYVPIPNHPRTAAEYGQLGEAFFGKMPASIQPFYETVDDTWLRQVLDKYKGFRVTHSEGDNPAKNSIAYHCVNHQKFAWLLKAAMLDPKPSVFIWMDYGIGHIPGVTPEVAFDFLNEVQEDDLAIPGCWAKDQAINTDLFPCWRFCGSLMVVPRSKVAPLYKAVKREVLAHLNKTKNVTWEVNTLARVEKDFPVRWYLADHNETMFTNYRDTVDEQG
jgi:hypothetical protein